MSNQVIKYFLKVKPILVYFVCCSFTLLLSCKKFVSLDTPGSALGEQIVFSTEANATSALLDVYPNINLIFGGSGFAPCVTKINGLYADDYRLTITYAEMIELYSNSLVATNSIILSNWGQYYQAIYKLNAFEENIKKYGSKIPKQTTDHLIGEAKFLRAFCYFNLVNIFGEVPLLLSSDYRQNSTASRKPESEIYAQIISDLREAEVMVSDDYLNDANLPGTTRIRPNKDVVRSMLARVHLYTGQWNEAAEYATIVINKNSTYVLESDLSSVFNLTSKEVIFQVPSNSPSSTSPQLASQFVLTGPPNTRDGSTQIGTMSSSLLGAFEAGDRRRSAAWVGSVSSAGNTYYFPQKYRTSSTTTQYLTYFRLAELYLIRAEANIQRNQVATGIADLNILRTRARNTATGLIPIPLPDLSSTLTQSQAMLALEQERRVELFMEGHRWFDLKRWKGLTNPAISRAEELMPAIVNAKGGTWQKSKLLFPIPDSERLINTNLTQNENY